MIDIKITDQSLNMEHCLAIIQDPRCGGTATFVGTVRNVTKGKSVVRLEFECYESMAIKEIQKIVNEAILLFSVHSIVVHHRIGILYPGEIAVIIAVNDGHRIPVFKACQYIIDTLKQRVTIWKKEIFEDGEQWVSAHP